MPALTTPQATKSAARLVPLHQCAEDFYLLPQEGSISIGRRAANNDIVCKDLAVSGQHCKVWKRADSGSGWYEVEDCSTNGTFVNDAKLEKGQRAPLNLGDILSLTRPDGSQVLPSGEVRSEPVIQFRLEAIRDTELGVEPPEALQRIASVHAGESGRTTVEETRHTSKFVTMSTTAEGFAQDLLVREQQSKAKITGELLLVRRRLDEERSKNATLQQELRTMHASLDAERSRCTGAQAGRDRLHAELEELRREHKELEETETKRLALQQRFDECEVDLGAQLQRATSLEAARERLQSDLEEARGSATRSEAQLAEVQSRLQQAQDRGEQIQAKHQEVRREADTAKQNVEKLQVDLSSERAAREHLEDQATLLAADAERVERARSSVADALKTAKDTHADLDARYHALKTETQASRENQKALEAQVSDQVDKASHFRNNAAIFADATREYMEQWHRNLAVAGVPAEGAAGAASVAQRSYIGLREEAEQHTMEEASPSRPSRPKLTRQRAGTIEASALIAKGDAVSRENKHHMEDCNASPELDNGSECPHLEAETPRDGTPVAEDGCFSQEAPTPHESAQSEEEKGDEELELPQQRNPTSPLQGPSTTAPLLSTNTAAVNGLQSPIAARVASAGVTASPLVISADDSPSHAADPVPLEEHLDSTKAARDAQAFEAPIDPDSLASDKGELRGPKRMVTQSIFGMEDHPPPSKKKKIATRMR